MAHVLIILSAAGFVHACNTNDFTCLQTIRKLSDHDAAFSGRIDIKINAANHSDSPTEFRRQMIQNAKHVGEYFTCGETMSWITEIFEGLESQYIEYRNSKQGPKAGYRNLIGDDLITFFEAQRKVKGRVIYHIQHVGTCDHVFTIEQIPDKKNDPNYRIYQSYNGAYSSKAWLGSELNDELYTQRNIIIPHLTYCINHSNNVSLLCMKLRSMFTELRSVLEGKNPIYDKFLAYIQTYDIQRATEMFKRSWISYGQSRQLRASKFFSDYLNKTKQVTEYMQVWSKTSTPFDSNVFNLWIDLYGSPLPNYFPGMPANTLQSLSAKVDYPSGYGFEVKTVYLPNNEEKINADCAKNAAILMNSVGIKRL